ncbi:BlaI/MecI/CopY family transcriptional regulator [Xylocopilactobacillus apicola]|uniref:Penicillinase repressor n=1 Tax=Xylocopilactobacillus apicola TaxID=2932184 RepID=A0AAU9D6L9_9LACO|nr:BlaI/MecI/CopY family transcriptional regulator [Xylocopilactobacillus apicola]BDR57935.1 hypothetical protein XA3_03760 [Xylocopilactobacillus apicola]
MIKRLTPGEEEVMFIIWKASEPLSTRDITNSKDRLNQNVVQSVVRRLLEKKFIKVCGIAHSGPSITRLYKPVIREVEYFSNVVPKDTLKKVVRHYLSKVNDEEELNDLKQILV